MISQHNLLIVRKLVILLHKYKAIPIKWNENQKKFSFDPNRLSNSYLHLFLNLVHIFLPFIKLYLIDGTEAFAKYTNSELIVCIGELLYLFAMLAMNLVILQNPIRTVIVLNSVETFVKKLPKKTSKSTASLLKVLDKFIYFIDLHLKLHGILGCIVCWLAPHLPIFLTSFATLNKPWLLPFRITYSVLLSYYFVCSGFLCSFIACHGLSSMPMFVIVMHKLCGPQPMALKKGRNDISGLFLYRQVEILLNVYWDFYGYLFIPCEGILVLGVTMYSCLLVMYRERLSTLYVLILLAAWIMASSCLVIVFETGGRFEMYSRRTLNAWKCKFTLCLKNVFEQKNMQKICKMYKPLNFNYKGYRKVKRGTLLELMKTVAKNTFRMVATFK